MQNRRLNIIACLTFFLFVISGSSLLSAQGWQTRFVYPNFDQKLQVITEATNGDFIGTARSFTPFLPFGGSYVFRCDPNGDTLFTKWYMSGILNQTPYPQGIDATADGGAVIGGWLNGSNQWSSYVLRVNANGDSLWTRHFSGNDQKYMRDIVVAPNGDILVCGEFRPSGGGFSDRDLWVARLDSTGATLWDTSFNVGNRDQSLNVRVAQDGNVVVFSSRQVNNDYRCHLMKLNYNTGGIIWQRTHNYRGSISPGAMALASDGGFYLAGNFNDPTIDTDNHMFLIKCDAAGDTVWTKMYLNPVLQSMQTLHEDVCGNIAVLERAWYQSQYTVGYAMLLDSLGTELWGRYLGNNTQISDMIVTPDSGMIICGDWYIDTLHAGPYIARMTKDGDILTNRISGRVYHDANSNCQYDSGEQIFPNSLVQITDQANPLPEYGTTNNNGTYAFETTTGNFDVLAWPPGVYWGQTCPANPLFQTVNFPNPRDSVDNIDFGFEPEYLCPLLSVNVATWGARRCSSSTFTVQYCNTGTIDATNVTIEIEMDSLFTVDSADVAWNTPQSGNTYVFDVGTVPVNACSTFYIYATLSCNAFFGQTHCVYAHIYPDSICLPIDPSWDSSFVEVEARCSSNTNRFVIRNNSANDMSVPGGYVILEDNILRVNNNNLQLLAGDSTVVTFPGNGSTWYLRAQQAAGHPGFSMPTAFVEGCGVNAQGEVSTGFITQYSMDDVDPFVDVFCIENTAAVDPNDKRAFPGGFGANNNVFQNEQFEYMIRFQNTGNDTAFRVVIRDTLTQDLDLTTFQSGASSHPYTYRVYGNRIIEWTFDGILLPDSTTNEPESHGFVMFTIDREGNLPVGHRINNDADIYFDYQPPVETNIAYVTLGEDVFVMVSLDPPFTETLRQPIKVYPNPMSESAVFDLGEYWDEVNLEVMDLNGRLMHEQQFHNTDRATLRRGQLTSGMYVFRLTSKGEVLGTGRIVVF